MVNINYTLYLLPLLAVVLGSISAYVFKLGLNRFYYGDPYRIGKIGPYKSDGIQFWNMAAALTLVYVAVGMFFVF